MLTDPPSILKQFPNESAETQGTVTRRMSSTAQNLDALAGLELLSSVSLAVGSEPSAQPVNPPTESLTSDSLARDSLDVSSAMQPHSTALSSDTNLPTSVSSADRLERACDLLGLSRKLPPDASVNLSCVPPFVGPRTLAQHNLADAHEKTLRATGDLQLVEQHARGLTFLFLFLFLVWLDYT